MTDFDINSSIFNNEFESSEDFDNTETTPTKSQKKEVAVQDFALIFFGLFCCDGLCY